MTERLKSIVFRNTISNFVAQGYSSAIGIIILPLFIPLFSAHEFGVITFFFVLSMITFILSTGLTPVLLQEAAIANHADQLTAPHFKSLVARLERTMCCLAASTILLFFFGREWIALTWLNAGPGLTGTLPYVVLLIGVILAVRWQVGLYTSGLMGLEQQGWLNSYSIVVMSARWIGGYGIVLMWPGELILYFVYNTVVSGLELFFIRRKFHRLIKSGRAVGTGEGVLPERGSAYVYRYMAYSIGSAMMWVVISQYEKILMSFLLTTDNYGRFAFVLILSSSIMRLAQPPIQAIAGRLTTLISARNFAAAYRLYRLSGQSVAIIGGSVAAVMCIVPWTCLFVITGDTDLASYGSPILPFFAIGNVLLALSSLIPTLLTSVGRMDVQFRISIFDCLMQIPAITYVSYQGSLLELAMVWCVLRGFILIASTLYICSFLDLRRWKSWLTDCLCRPIIGAIIGVSLVLPLNNLFDQKLYSESRLILGIITIGYFFIIFCAMLGSTGEILSIVKTKLRQHLVDPV